MATTKKNYDTNMFVVKWYTERRLKIKRYASGKSFLHSLIKTSIGIASVIRDIQRNGFVYKTVYIPLV